MATLPSSGTNIRFLSGVPFSNDYKHTRWFDDLASQNTYFGSRQVVHRMSEASFTRIEGKGYISANAPIDSLLETNYLMFQNQQYNSKWFYAFVTKLERKNQSVTHVYFEIDVLQTWLFNYDFKPSFVIREHCPLWNDDGTPVINTVDEGLNYGSEYEIVYAEHKEVYQQLQFMVIVCKSLMHGKDDEKKKVAPVLNGMPQPLTFYIHPFFPENGKVPTIDGGEKLTSVNDTLKGLYANEDAQNNIVSIYITEYLGISFDYDSENFDLKLPADVFNIASISDNVSGNVQTLYLKNYPKYSTKSIDCGLKYSDFDDVKESKLLMYPYSLTEVTDFRGTHLTVKNEYIKKDELNILYKGSSGVSNKTSFSIDSYNYEIDGDLSDIISNLFSGMNNRPNDVPIITDLLSAYLQGNRNSLQNQQDTIMWNGAMNMVQGGVYGGASAYQGNAGGTALGLTQVVNGMGDAQLQLQGLETKKKDIDNLPPSLQKMGTNSYYDYGNQYKGIYIIKKMIKPEYKKKLEDYFKVFGYKVNEVKVPNFHTRKNWNYVQTNSCNIVGNFNTEDLNELKAVFDNGITLWHTDDIGNYSLSNGVI